ncbi:Diencephalon/mesencephalon homeobox protein 1-B [Tolypocladium ophioglossoides CBS 100239]|uniref:Diencephalon/mesencephalon homeobox protein 1-B n=1 Tax=Tolypocladium ophioglossoides (strain CBS 100239) TaxID=1163406 RepID=A0A0L0NNE8_TOLOC|nr:Diencephalon/mesencephalon homeobox protein 1-B [Tolypocladium ophioglossoides CBS 100239]
MGPFSQSQWPSWTYSGLGDPFSGYAQVSNCPAYLADSMETYQNHNRHLVHHHQLSRTTESKPRLSKEEVEVLEAEFQKNHKPSSSTKKALAESMRVDNARINNWFQNRRAREKKENNIREYEAKQRLEKEKAGAESGHQFESTRHCDLVASSAPFPEPRMNFGSRADASQSPSVQSVLETASETTEPSQSDDSDSPRPVKTEPVKTEPVDFSNIDASSVGSDLDDDMMSDELPEQIDGYFNLTDACVGMSVKGPEPLSLVDAKASGQLFSGYQSFMSPHSVQRDTEALDQSFTTAALPQLSPLVDDTQPKPSQPIDIASRRNRRPAPLAIVGGRSQSSYSPRTATDFDRRGDRTSPMRRVASAAGSVRIKKPAATPRSPFYDASFQSRRSPSTTGPVGSGAPPTPDTPITLHQQGLVDGTVRYSLDSKYMSADPALRDPTLRTPPTTPGFMDSLFNISSTYGMSISEETLIAPGISRLPGGFEMSSMTGGVSGFIDNASNCSRQNETSLLSSQMGSTYFNFMGANPDYNWSDASTSTSSSPEHHTQRGGYMIMPTTNFSHD